MEGLKKPYDNEQSIKELFSKLVGSVSFFRIPPNQKGDTRFFGYCFLEFNDKSNVERAVQLVNRYNTANTDEDDPMSDESDTRELADKLNLRVMSKYCHFTPEIIYVFIMILLYVGHNGMI